MSERSHQNRYARQEVLPQVGAEGQARLARGHVAIVGLGALGCAAADLLARAGVGTLTLIDRDVVEWTNLQRQTLYTERDAAAGTPKAEAAAARIAEINGGVACVVRAADMTGENAEAVLGVPGPAVLLDATDNLETRFLLNDVSVKHGVALAYGGVIGTRGMHATFVSGAGRPCLRCVFGGPGAPGATPTCDTAGVLGSAVATVSAAQVVDAIKVLLGDGGGILTALTDLDVWTGHRRTVQLGPPDPACPACGKRQFQFLDSVVGDSAALCGQNAVQVRPAGAGCVDLDALAARLGRIGEVERTRFMLRFVSREVEGVRLSVFGDGRAIVHGTASPQAARAMYARFVGA